MTSLKDIQNRADMRYLEEFYQSQKYRDIPCANCGLHYWKVPKENGDVTLKCPKCDKFTRVQKDDYRLKIDPY